MEKKGFYFYLSGLFSISIYLSLIFFIFTLLGEFEKKAKRYTSQKNNFIVVSIAEKSDIIKKKSVKKRSIKKSVKKEVPKKKKPTKKNKIKKSMKRTVKDDSLKSLFSGIDPKKYKKKIKDKNVTKKIPNNQNSRFLQKKSGTSSEKKSATKLIKSLSLENISSASNKKAGEYDKYIGKISDILDEKWQNTPGSIAGNQATVTVKIDKFGNFSYKIDSLSYNNEFNAKLQNFLDSLKDENFPPYEGGDFIELKVNFKDE
ncbi:MAG: TonB C-terminal domain-containing protein [Epsilonproteobacteria bacterium]|nr:TonB C-terminal domain-containing protein [Campylobacterota bacterium]